jgi:hexosaminidase
MRPSYKACIVLISSLSLIFGCSQSTNSLEKKPINTQASVIDFDNIIPLPVAAKQGTEHFVLANTNHILVSASQPKLVAVASYLTSSISSFVTSSIQTSVMSEQKLLDINLSKSDGSQNRIVLFVDGELNGGPESYNIVIDKHLLKVVGGSAAGVFRGVQTLKQLLPVADDNKLPALNTGVIKDYPRFEHRGFMLDVARHFYTVEEVKQVIDYLASYKYNVFHFHLTDDQGWRIDIPSWPKLTEVGSNSAVGKESCDNCFYSLDEYQEIVQYADERFITLIPEIDVPGHVKAALASYPDELYCDGDKPEWPYTGIKVRISSLCFSNPKIYDFFNDVVSEVAKRTTGQYIHVGGDETPKWVKHQDYADFMLKASGIISKHGKTMIGWTNDLGSVVGLPTDVIGQDWSTKKHCCENTLNMAKNGNKIVMSPANKAYLDLKYDKDAPIGLHWAGYNSIENSYNWDPELMIDGLTAKNIIGVEAALWGETIKSMADAQYMIFPRLLSLSEVAWSPQEQRSWSGFSKRLAQQLDTFEQQGLYYRPLAKEGLLSKQAN